MRRGLRVFVLIDALGWRILEGREFLSDLLPYRRPLRTVLGFSSGAIPTILTGLPPALHGHWNLFYYDPEGSPFRWLRPFGFLPERLLNHRVTAKLLKELGRHVLGLGPLFECFVSPRLLPYFNWVEKRNIYDCGGLDGHASIFDQLAASGTSYRVYSYHQYSDAQILDQARQDITASRSEFYFLYLSELDAFLHKHCADDAAVSERLRSYEAALRELFALALRADPHAWFTVFSDHGMTRVRSCCDLVEEVERLGFSMPADYLAVYDSTMARFWFFSGVARRRMASRLDTLSCGRILFDNELRELGVLFPDRRYGELVFLLHPGWLISGSDFSTRQQTPAGMHGYHPSDPWSDAVLLSNRRPGLRPRTITDVYDWMREPVAEL